MIEVQAHRKERKVSWEGSKWWNSVRTNKESREIRYNRESEVRKRVIVRKRVMGEKES